MRKLFCVIVLFLAICRAGPVTAEELTSCTAENDRATLEMCTGHLQETADDKQRAYSLFERGSAYARLRQWNHAIRDMTSAVALWPSYAQAYSERAYCHVALSQFDLAILDYSHAIALTPSARYLRERRSVAWRARGEAISALADIAGEIDNARRTVGSSAEDIYYRAYGLALGTEYLRARDVLDEAVTLAPSDGKARLLRGYLHLMLDDPAKAVTDYTAAIEALPDDIDGYTGRGEAYQRLGDPRMTADLEHALTLLADVHSSDDLNNRAWVKFLLGRHEAALPDATEALKQTPNDPHFLHTRGRILMALGQREAATQDYRTALRFDPNHTETLAELRRID